MFNLGTTRFTNHLGVKQPKQQAYSLLCGGGHRRTRRRTNSTPQMEGKEQRQERCKTPQVWDIPEH